MNRLHRLFIISGGVIYEFVDVLKSVLFFYTSCLQSCGQAGFGKDALRKRCDLAGDVFPELFEHIDKDRELSLCGLGKRFDVFCFLQGFKETDSIVSGISTNSVCCYLSYAASGCVYDAQQRNFIIRVDKDF